MQPGYHRTHGSSIRLAQALVETTLQCKLDHTFLLLDHGTHLEEAVGGADIGVAGGITTANSDVVFGLLQDLEVIGDQGADLIGVGEEVLALPQVGGCLGTLVLASEPGALSHVACTETAIS